MDLADEMQISLAEENGASCWGRECKLGWGYNQSLDLLIPVEEEAPLIISESVNQWGYEVCNLSSTDIYYSVGF